MNVINFIAVVGVYMIIGPLFALGWVARFVYGCLRAGWDA